jgi:hypothetical protein
MTKKKLIKKTLSQINHINTANKTNVDQIEKDIQECVNHVTYLKSYVNF